MTGYQPAVNIFPAPDITTTLQSGSSAISLKRVTISLTRGGKKTSIQFNGKKTDFNNKCLSVLIIFITLEVEGVKREL